jgi:hypothetical protein
VDVIIPPTMGAAIGFITSEPKYHSPREWGQAGENGANRHQLWPEPMYSTLDGGLLNIGFWKRAT